MHLITLVESYPGNFDKFESWMASRELKNGKSWNIKPREIRLYDLVIPKEAEEEVLSLLKPINHYRHVGKIHKIIKLVSKLFKVLLPVNNNVEPTPFKELGWWAYATPIGKIEDSLRENGEEGI